ncbi:MAG: hypothetical protein K9K38_16210 [Rhodoferax sp.]|nr:hypothetical protein [Rhodoferax sp.]
MERLTPPANLLTPESFTSVLGQHDPLLQELWAIKAQINKDAQYSVDIRFKQLQGMNWEVARSRLENAAR